MRTLVALALLIPALALAAPSAREWQRFQGERIEVVYTDGTVEVGTVEAVEEDQARLRKDDGKLTLVPLLVVSELRTIEAAPARQSPSMPPPPPAAPAPTRRGPSVGVGVGVGSGPVSVGVGTRLGGNPPAGPTAGRYNHNIVGVRYPLSGRETIDWLLTDERGNPQEPPADLLRPRALRGLVFVNEWGQSVPLQVGWASLGAERDYVARVRKIERTMMPIRTTESVLGIGGLGLLVYGFVASTDPARFPNGRLATITGSVFVIGNIGVSLGVTGPTRARLEADLGRDSLDLARQSYR